MDELCDAIDDMVRSERQNRTLRWFLAGMTLFSLLTIAATVGLTYAVVALSKDTQVSGEALVAKDTGAALRTGVNLDALDPYNLAQTLASETDTAMLLAHLSSVQVPGNASDEEYVVHRVASAALLKNNAGVRVRTVDGDSIDFYAFQPRPDDAAPPTTAAMSPATRRRLTALEWSQSGCSAARRRLLGKSKRIYTFDGYTVTRAVCAATLKDLMAPGNCAGGVGFEYERSEMHQFTAKFALQILETQVANTDLAKRKPEGWEEAVAGNNDNIDTWWEEICAQKEAGYVSSGCWSWAERSLGQYAACMRKYTMFKD